MEISDPTNINPRQSAEDQEENPYKVDENNEVGEKIGHEKFPLNPRPSFNFIPYTGRSQGDPIPGESGGPAVE